jgi:hypothetical protein
MAYAPQTAVSTPPDCPLLSHSALLVRHRVDDSIVAFVTVASKIYRSASEKGDLLVTIQAVRFNGKATHVKEFESAANRITKAFREAAICGVRHSICKSNDGITFLGILHLSEGMKNPLPTLANGKTFLKGLETWLAFPPERLPWEQMAEFSGLANSGENR